VTGYRGLLGLNFIHIQSLHSDVPGSPDVGVHPCPALASVILEANPLDVVLWP
jgi:hypothetical protein